jgi:serine/threonine-protein kinase HipA
VHQTVEAMVANRAKIMAKVAALLGATAGYVIQTADAVENNALRILGRR